MIVDQLSSIDAPLYRGLLNDHGGAFGLGERLRMGLRWLQETDLLALSPSRIELAGDRVFAMIQHYETKPVAKGAWEAHRKYLDIQYVAEGQELMGYANLGSMAAGSYDAEKDFLLLQGQGSFVTLTAGMFTILLPEDAHMPQIAVGDVPSPVKKVVLKIVVAD
jgi:YhcH/YjgK/YiaL family protein